MHSRKMDLCPALPTAVLVKTYVLHDATPEFSIILPHMDSLNLLSGPIHQLVKCIRFQTR
jgi:hypothetical protein